MAFNPTDATLARLILLLRRRLSLPILAPPAPGTAIQFKVLNAAEADVAARRDRLEGLWRRRCYHEVG